MLNKNKKIREILSRLDDLERRTGNLVLMKNEVEDLTRIKTTLIELIRSFDETKNSIISIYVDFRTKYNTEVVKNPQNIGLLNDYAIGMHSADKIFRILYGRNIVEDIADYYIKEH